MMKDSKTTLRKCFGRQQSEPRPSQSEPRPSGSGRRSQAGPLDSGENHSLTVAALIRKRPHKHCLSIAISTIGLILATGAAEAQTTWFVDADGAAGGGCTSWVDACPSLQTALGLASPGDAIWVATGTYMPDDGYTPVGGIHVAGSGDRSATFQLLNGVAIYGGFAGTEDPATFDLADRDVTANETILSGDLNGDDAPGTDPADLLNEPTRTENSFHIVTGNDTDETAVIDGFTISGGNSTSFFNPIPRGAGMLNFFGSPTIKNCTFQANSSSSIGGAMYNLNSSAVLTRCTFNGNHASFVGAGMRNGFSDVQVVECTFSDNWSFEGGAGMANAFSSPSLIRCTFNGNVSILDGAGLQNTNGSSPIVSNCVFHRNSILSANGRGGALFNGFSSNSTIIGCTFTENSAISFGGAINNVSNSSIVTNCTFIGNSAAFGGGLSNSAASTIVVNCSFMGNIATNDGTGMYNANNNSITTVVNCIFRGTTTGVFSGPDLPVVMFSNVEGGFPGTGNIDADPLFVDPLGPDGIAGTEDDDLRLMPGSPCIDAGDNASVPADMADLDGDGDTTEPTPFDLDGNPRIVNDTVDMGAYEVQPPDCNGNGVPDDQDIANGTSADCNENGIPDECDGFIDATPPEIACSIVPAQEDDSEDGEDEGDDSNDEDAGQQSGSGSGLSSDHGNAGISGLNQPTGAAVTLRDSGGEGIGTPDGHRIGDTISDEGYDGPIMILFDAMDDCGEVTLSAIIDIGCMQIPVENGTVIAFECNEGDDSGDCEAEEDDGILEIEAASAVMIVTATDESGNTSTCEIVLCSPPNDSSDDDEGDAGAASEGRPNKPQPKARGPRLEEGGSASR